MGKKTKKTFAGRQQKAKNKQIAPSTSNSSNSSENEKHNQTVAEEDTRLKQNSNEAENEDLANYVQTFCDMKPKGKPKQNISKSENMTISKIKDLKKTSTTSKDLTYDKSKTRRLDDDNDDNDDDDDDDNDDDNEKDNGDNNHDNDKIDNQSGIEIEHNDNGNNNDNGEKNENINDIQNEEIEKEIERHKVVADFMKSQADLEKKRLEKHGAKVNLIPVKNTGIIRESKKKIINRIELNSSLDFDNVSQLMVSDPIAVPTRDDCSYVNVILLMVSSPVAQLVPYVFLQEKENTLQHWLLINNQFKRTKLMIRSQDFKKVK